MDIIISVLIYLGIFLAKMVEVALATLRVVLNSRGEKLRGALIGFFEVLIWIIVVSNVLGSITEDPIKVVVYCLAFSCGNYLGITLENKLAIGNASITAVVSDEQKDNLSNLLREKGFGVTIIEGHGMERSVDVMMIYLKRKAVPEAIETIRDICPDAMITVNDVRQLRNAYIRK